MIHTFDCLGHSFLLDVESGSVFIVDSLTKALVENLNSPVDYSRGEFSRYTTEEIEEAKSELDVHIKKIKFFAAKQFVFLHR